MFDVAFDEMTTSEWPAVAPQARAANEIPQTLQTVFLIRPDMIPSSDARARTYHASDAEAIPGLLGS
jgi:hypothetical protein